MKKTSSDIRSLLKILVGIDALPTAVLGTIVSVDEDEMTCEVNPIGGGANYMDVKIMAENSTTGMLFKPSVDSLVLIAPQSTDIDRKSVV